ncbi:alpha/beta hydrolase family protein [Daejeonella lutea]|uniref:Serine aminopeptidase, S33 n=1 Tax=Daejeonella lutea TaxID=572036 RepID=A0A1T5F623_9SPHI|nr:alpha/beta fold hydrolase [Daejeonella lutea]SKB91624.1 Serine aminopeptidase, S33 [Daejeonella lutea]
MKLNCYCLASVLLIIISITSCKSGRDHLTKPDDKYLNNDFKPDEFYPGGQVELTIPSSGSNMYGLAYTADGKGPHPTVILLHGLPGNERSLDMAQSIRRGGYNVIYFNYRGAWGSKGTFGFQNSIDDVGAVLDYITDSANSSTLKVDKERIALFGHSMGAGFALIAGMKDPRIKSVIGVSVFNPFTLLQGEGAEGNLRGLKEYLLTLGMLNCDPNKFLTDILNNLDKYNIESMISKTRKPVLVIDEHMNNQGFTKFNKKKDFTYKIWNTDHAFSNRRIALTTEAKNWFDKTIPRLETPED